MCLVRFLPGEIVHEDAAATAFPAPTRADLPEHPDPVPAACRLGRRAGRQRRAAARAGRGRAAARGGRRGGGAARRAAADRFRRHRLDAHLDRAGRADDDSRPRAVLRRHGPQDERALGADAGIRHLLHDLDRLDGPRLQPGLRGGQRLCRRPGSDAAFRAHARRRHGHHSRVGLHDVPDDLRDHHPGADRRRLRRAHEVLGHAGLHRAVVARRLRADRALGVGTGRLSSERRRARLCRRHGGAHQRRRGGAGLRAGARQAPWLRPRADAAAQSHAEPDRRLAALGRLVRLQRRLGSRRRTAAPAWPWR